MNTPSETASVASMASTTSEFRETLNSKLTRSFNETPNDPRFDYQLYAVIVHLGNSTGGHYICFKAINIDEPQEGNWLQISDSDVREVTFEHVKKQYAYMLFYQKRTPSPEYSNRLTNASAPASDSSLDNLSLSHSINGMPLFPLPIEPLDIGNHVTASEEQGSSSSSSSLSSSLPTTSSSTSPETSERHRHSSNDIKAFLEPEEDDEEEEEVRTGEPGLRSAQGIPIELLTRPLQDFSTHTDGFDAIVARADG